MEKVTMLRQVEPYLCAAAATVVIGCKNSSSGTGTDTALTRYSVTYHGVGGGGTVPTDANTYTVGQTVTAAAAPAGLTAPADKAFAGWNTQGRWKWN